MIYEREITTENAREKPIANWNVFGDVIVFQECNQVCMVKCYKKKVDPFSQGPNLITAEILKDYDFYSFVLPLKF